MEGKAWCRMWQTIAAMLLLCSLALCLIYFSLHGILKVDKHDEDIGEAETLESMKGSILFNEKELDYQSDYAAATENVLTQSDYKVVDDMAVAVWRLLNASLECGSNEFKLKAMGPGAADLQLEMESKKPIPLIQAPKECGFSVKQTALGLVVIVPYDGCSVKQENGTYTFIMKWREDNIRIICTVLETPDEIPATSESSQPPETTSSLMLQSPYRSKRHLRWLPMYYPCSPNKRFPLCLYTPPPQTTTTPEPTFPPLIHPYYMQKLLSLYPIYDAYENYLNMNPQRVMQRFTGKNLGWKLLQMHEKPQKPPHPFQHLFERPPHTTTTAPPTTIKTTTPCTTTTTTTSGGNGCSSFWNQLFHQRKFSPRGLIHDQDHLQFMGEDDYRAGYQTQDVADSFWESDALQLKMIL